MANPSRASETRLAAMRPSFGSDMAGELDIDLTGLPIGMEARWVRETTLGERDAANISRAMRNGFQPATTTMLPHAEPPLFPGDTPNEHGLIRRGGQVLMIREKRLGDAERAQQRRIVDEQKLATRQLSAPGGESGASFDGENFIPEARVTERTDINTRDGLVQHKGGERFKDA